MNAPSLPCPSLPKLDARTSNAHKGDFGTALLIGGSRGMAGAIAMAGLAAATSGAGLVRLAVPDCCLETVAGFSPCAMIAPLPCDANGKISGKWNSIAPLLERVTCIAMGPGLGQSKELRELVHVVIENTQVPLVIDADGLNGIGTTQTILELRRGNAADLVLTPHPGEWARLTGIPANDREKQIAASVEFTRSCGATVVLKGQHTIVTDGVSLVRNTTGTPAMATGGSGDVLTGIITALICQGLPPRDASQLGVYVHGLAGQLAEQRLGYHVVLPTELIQSLPAAFAQAAK